MEKTITIATRKSPAVDEWMRKEHGSWEDHDMSPDHAYPLLKMFGGKLTLTESQANTLIKSGDFHSTGWDEDDIEGGIVTMRVISKYVYKLKDALRKLHPHK